MAKRIEPPEPQVIYGRYYSGDSSAGFWAAVRRTGDRELYSHACTLQDAELRVVASLNRHSELAWFDRPKRKKAAR